MNVNKHLNPLICRKNCETMKSGMAIFTNIIL
jgi:hypothetical protein